MYDLENVNINSRTYTNKILTNIFELLRDSNKEIKETEEVKEYEEMKRPELLGLVRVMDNKPKGYMRWTNDKIIQFLKEVGNDD